MRLEGHLYCDGPDCEVNWHAGLSRFENRTLTSFPPGWFLVSEWDEQGVTERSFCGADCLMKWGAGFEPPEVISFGEQER